MLRPLSFLCAVALAFPAHAAAPSCLAGQYDGGEIEVAAGLALSADGRFRYGLSYGALDEQAQGAWESDGTKVFLTSDPVKPAGFSLVSEGAAPAGEFRLGLDLPDGISPQHFNALLTLSDGRTLGRPLGFDDWVVTLQPGERVVSVKFMLPALDIESERFPVSAGTAAEARFAFATNDLGKVAFAREPLVIDGGALLLARHGRRLRFRAVQGGC